jgi:hypothetical protein
MKILLAVILLGSFIGVRAQKGTGYSSVNRIMSRIPDSLTYSTEGIADYINSNFSIQKEKSRAVFIWIAKNIQYDFDSIFTANYYQNPSEVSEKILKTRIGVCLQYADLFSEIASKVGIKSYVIQGYTQQHGVVDYLPHVWSAGFIDSAWYLFDPTWGSGFVTNGRFVKQVNYYYFMAKPENLIKSHMPFDPLWQFLNYPFTNQEFYEKNFRIGKNRPFFNFSDTLYKYEHESEIERYISSARRIEQNGVRNSFISAKLQVLKGEIEYYRNKKIAERYSTAVNLYNEGIKKLNRFINFSNNSFKPEKDPGEIKQILDSTEYLLTASIETLNEIKNPEESLAASIILLNHSINDTMKVLNDQRASLDRYLKSRRQSR